MTFAPGQTILPVHIINPHALFNPTRNYEPTESPEDHRPGFFCVYEIYFKGCGLTFPLPEALVRYLAALEIALPQLTPNLLRTIMCIITIVVVMPLTKTRT
ncbi:hypothetical protein AtNW77_Chr3g0194181 [Arabidopsis thaliana]